MRKHNCGNPEKARFGKVDWRCHANDIICTINCDVELSKNANITKYKVKFKKSEILAIIPLWYGMVWCGGAEQKLAFKCFYISVGKIDLHQTKKY